MDKRIEQIIFKLKSKKINLSVAESCTGGLLAESITSVSGASKVFNFGVITYSNHSKINYLKVPNKIIKMYGSVSKECCLSMVTNLSKISKSKLNLAITGIAGPNGGTKQKPVGLVYIGIKKKKKTKIIRYLFKKKKKKYIIKNFFKKYLYII